MERPLHRQRGRVNVPLWDIPDRPAEGIGFVEHVMAADAQLPGSDLTLAKHRSHECALAGPTGAEHTDELPRLDPQAHVVQQRLLFTAAARRNSYRHLLSHHREAGRLLVSHAEESFQSSLKSGERITFPSASAMYLWRCWTSLLRKLDRTVSE